MRFLLKHSLASVLILLIPTVCFFQQGQDFAKIKEAVEKREYSSAIEILIELKRNNQAAFEELNYDYLLARLAEKDGDFALAMASYHSVAKRNSILKQYALWHMAKISASVGDLAIERIFLNEVLTDSPRSLLRQAAEKRLAKSFFETGDFPQTVIALSTSFSDSATSAEPDREALSLLGTAYLRMGEKEKARAVFQQILNESPNPSQPDDFDLVAVKGLDELDAGASLSDEEHVRRGKIYFFNREFQQARSHFSRTVEDFSQSALIPEAMYLLARSYMSEENYQEAIKWFERVIAEFPSSDSARDAISQVATAYARVNKPREAIARYKRYIELYPNEQRLERAYLNIIDILRDIGEENDALTWIERTRRDFAGKDAELVALFARVRMRMATSDWSNALKDLEELEKTVKVLQNKTVIGGTDEIEVKFLKAYCLEKLKQYREAVEIYLSIPEGRKSYYGWRSTERLKNLLANDEATVFIRQKAPCALIEQKPITTANADSMRQTLQNCLRLTEKNEEKAKLLEALKKTYSLLPAYRKAPALKLLDLKDKNFPKTNNALRRAIAETLISLGLYDEGASELEADLRESSVSTSKDSSKEGLFSFPQDVTFTLAFYYAKGEIPSRSTAWLESLWREMPSDYQIQAIPTQQLQILYPLAYSDVVLRNSEQKNLDPRFVLSIIKQESSFRSDARSSAAARGLMQIIAPTANRIAVELGKNNFSTDELYNPFVSIAFGTEYLSRLSRIFSNQLQAVAASYNGGENNMLRWFVRSKSSDPDQYVPEILFPQSKDYVFKVMMNLRAYQMIYNDKLITK